MAGLGTLFILLMGVATLLQWHDALLRSRPVLWMLMLAFPFPYIATTAGWMTAELGRQPWLVYGLMRTSQGVSPTVHSGTVLFTLIGFTGLYFVLGLLFLFLVGREIAHGPVPLGTWRRGCRTGARGCMLVELWFAIAAVMLTAYVVLDGFDLGAGALHLYVARTDQERRQVLAAIGPYWDGNEVWLLATGGALFVAFPPVLASGLSGFYFAIFLVLWSLILRGISIEFRSHIEHPLWRTAWDFVFCAGSAVLPVLFGAALGNLLRGLPIDGQGYFALALFTDFTARPPVGILDWYTVLAGIFGLLAIAGHGATFLAWKTDGEVHVRSHRAAMWFYGAVAVLWPLATVLTRYRQRRSVRGAAGSPAGLASPCWSPSPG